MNELNKLFEHKLAQTLGSGVIFIGGMIFVAFMIEKYYTIKVYRQWDKINQENISNGYTSTVQVKK